MRNAIAVLCVLVGACALAGCNADSGPGGSAGGTGGGGNGGGGNGGGDCLVRDPVTGICVIGPGTDIPNMTCTAAPPAGSVVSSETSGALCGISDQVCNVENALNAADRNFGDFAIINYDLGALDPALGGAVTLRVDLPSSVSPGHVAAFMVRFPGGVLDLSLLRALHVTTALNGSVQEESAFDSALALDVLGVFPDTGRVLVGFRNTQAYNALSLAVDATLVSVDVTEAVYVYEACIDAS